MSPDEVASRFAPQSQESASPDQPGNLATNSPTSPTSSSAASTIRPISPPRHILRVQDIFAKRSVFDNPPFSAPRLPGQPKFEAAARTIPLAYRSVPSGPRKQARLRSAMVEFGKSIVAQHDNQKLLGELPGDEMSVDHMETDVEMREDTEVAMSPRTSTPRQGSAHSHGLLTPNATTVVIPPNKQDQYPFTWTTKPINPALTYGRTPDRPHPWTYKSPGSMLSPGQGPAVEAPSPESGYYNLRGSGESRIASPATDEGMANAPDPMKPRPDPYFRQRGMVSIDEVDEAHDTLLAHMRTRFRHTQDSTLPVQDATNFPVLPPPSSMLAHRQQSNLPNRAQILLPPNFQTPQHLTIKSRHQIQSLSDILAAERTKNHNARDLAGLSFHHVVQQPFTNELRAHYTAGSSPAGVVRGITMYKLQLPVAENIRERADRMDRYERQTEMWYFFALSGQPSPEHNVYQRGNSTEHTILALPAEDWEENKSEECPLFRGGGEQIQARRREYTVRAGGRFRLEAIVAMDHPWASIRQDLQDGSCRLFTWIEV